MTSTSPDTGKCTHFQPADLIGLAENHLRLTEVPEADWEGRRFEWGGPIESPPFNGLVLGCKRRDGDWVVTKIDRRQTGITEEETGFREIVGT